MSLKYEDVQEILSIIDQSTTKELHIEVDDFKLIVRKHNGDGVVIDESPVPAPKKHPPEPANLVSEEKEIGSGSGTSNTHSAPSATTIPLKSPLSGTFYRAPAPGETPFIKEGAAVKSGSTVCILDVMKVMNALKAPCDGTVLSIPVEDAQAVTAGQPVIWFEPN